MSAGRPELGENEALQAVLSRLAGVRRSGGAYSARCPAHSDHHASLRVTLGNNGRVLFHCFVGCTDEAIRAALGLRSDDEQPDARPRAKRTPVRRHLYQGPDGLPVAVKLRWRGRGARFSWELPDGTAGLNGLDPGLYRRPEVDAAMRAGGVVWLVEGEHDADTLAAVGLTATTGPHGAGTWRASWTATLAGAAVVMVADRDRKGVEHARAVTAELVGAGCTVRTLVPPLTAKDVTELVEAGGTVDDLEVLTDDIDVDTPKVRLTRDGRPAFAVIPTCWAELLDPYCLTLMVRLDGEQGDAGEPMAGRNNLARTLRWSREQTDDHLRHLAGAGIITIESRGQKQARYRVKNPSRRSATKTSGPSGEPPADRLTVHPAATCGPSQEPLPSSSGLKTFSGDVERVGIPEKLAEDRSLNLVLEAFPNAEAIADDGHASVAAPDAAEIETVAAPEITRKDVAEKARARELILSATTRMAATTDNAGHSPESGSFGTPPADEEPANSDGETEDEAVAALVRVFPGAELVDEDHVDAAEPIANPYHCVSCGTRVVPAPASVERGWSTVCRACEKATS